MSVPRLPPIASAKVPAPVAVPQQRKYSTLQLNMRGMELHNEAIRTQNLAVIPSKKLADHEVHIIDGKLAAGKGKKKIFLNMHSGDTKNRDLLFVMFSDRKIYVAYDVGTVYHTSFFGSKDGRPWMYIDTPAIAVGHIRTLEGRLTTISEESDQFDPAVRLGLVLQVLGKMGADLTHLVAKSGSLTLPLR